MIDLDRMLADNPDALRRQMQAQQEAMEMLEQIKGILSQQVASTRDRLPDVPDLFVQFAIAHNAKVIVNAIAAHMITCINGEPPDIHNMEGFLSACFVQAREDYERQKEAKASAS